MKSIPILLLGLLMASCTQKGVMAQAGEQRAARYAEALEMLNPTGKP